MSARPDASTPSNADLTVTALSGDSELAMFEAVQLDGDVLVVRTRFALAVGEELPLQVTSIGRTIGRVTGHRMHDGKEFTELLLLPPRPVNGS